MTISIGLSDFYKMIITVLKYSFIKLNSEKTQYRDYKKFSSYLFRLQHRCFPVNIAKFLMDSIFYRTHLVAVSDRANKDYGSFEDTFMKTLDRHAPMKKKFVRANEVPYMTKH